MLKDSSQLKLSILILSIPSRLDKYVALQDKLLGQIGDREDRQLYCRGTHFIRGRRLRFAKNRVKIESMNSRHKHGNKHITT